jgi:hypothetical protein
MELAAVCQQCQATELQIIRVSSLGKRRFERAPKTPQILIQTNAGRQESESAS